MSCEICGRNSCSRVFHSLESQNEFDEVADKVKDRIKAELKHNVNRLNYEEINDKTIGCICSVRFETRNLTKPQMLIRMINLNIPLNLTLHIHLVMCSNFVGGIWTKF